MAIEDSVGATSNAESKNEENFLDTLGNSIEYMECVQDNVVTSVVRCSERKPKPKNYENFVTYMCTGEGTEQTKILLLLLLMVTEVLSRIDKNMQSMREKRVFSKKMMLGN